jgi:hypothetical protein
MEDLIQKLETYDFQCEAGPLEKCQDWINLKELLLKTKEVYAVISNTDLTEGRGQQHIVAFCEKKATAIRLGKGGYVQGCDCPVEQITLFWRANKWFGPVVVVRPTAEDEKKQRNIDARSEALNKARAMGLSENEINLISGVPS